MPQPHDGDFQREIAYVGNGSVFHLSRLPHAQATHRWRHSRLRRKFTRVLGDVRCVASH